MPRRRSRPDPVPAVPRRRRRVSNQPATSGNGSSGDCLLVCDACDPEAAFDEADFDEHVRTHHPEPAAPPSSVADDGGAGQPPSAYTPPRNVCSADSGLVAETSESGGSSGGNSELPSDEDSLDVDDDLNLDNFLEIADEFCDELGATLEQISAPEGASGAAVAPEDPEASTRPSRLRNSRLPDADDSSAFGADRRVLPSAHCTLGDRLAFLNGEPPPPPVHMNFGFGDDSSDDDEPEEPLEGGDQGYEAVDVLENEDVDIVSIGDSSLEAHAETIEGSLDVVFVSDGAENEEASFVNTSPGYSVGSDSGVAATPTAATSDSDVYFDSDLGDDIFDEGTAPAFGEMNPSVFEGLPSDMSSLVATYLPGFGLFVQFETEPQPTGVASTMSSRESNYFPFFDPSINVGTEPPPPLVRRAAVSGRLRSFEELICLSSPPTPSPSPTPPPPTPIPMTSMQVQIPAQTMAYVAQSCYVPQPVQLAETKAAVMYMQAPVDFVQPPKQISASSSRYPYACLACGLGASFPDKASLVLHEMMVHSRTGVGADDLDDCVQDDRVPASDGGENIVSYDQQTYAVLQSTSLKQQAPSGGWCYMSYPQCPCR